MPQELELVAGILGPAAAVIGGLAAVGGLALILDPGNGSLAGALNGPGGDKIQLGSS